MKLRLNHKAKQPAFPEPQPAPTMGQAKVGGRCCCGGTLIGTDNGLIDRCTDCGVEWA